MPFRPLVELHCHLDGSLRLSTIIDIAKQESVPLPYWTEAELHAHMRCGLPMDLQHYITVPFGVTTSVMQTKDAIERIAYELVEDWAKDGILYGEVRYMPTLHLRRGMLAVESVEAVLAGLRRGESAFGVKSGLILCSMRHMPPAETELMMHLAELYRDDGVVGVDLAGNDQLAALEHARCYAWARHHLGVTIHGSEAGPASRTTEALDLFKAQRIGHGLRIGEDPDVLSRVIASRTCLEVCPTSNVQIGMTPSVEAHPAQGYFRAGANVTINCDNRLLADTTLTKEFSKVRKLWNLTDADLRRLVLNAINASWAEAHVKQMLFQELDA